MNYQQLSQNASQPIRLPECKGYKLWWEGTYNGLPVLTSHGPLIEGYLSNLYTTIHLALDSYRRVLAIRFDLRFPAHWSLEEIALMEGGSRSVISRFWETVKAKIKHDRSQAAKYLERSHDTSVRYVWIREVGEEGRPHYHCLMLLNRDAYFSLGHDYSESMNMLVRLQEAWCDRLQLPWREYRALVHIPDNPVYALESPKKSSEGSFDPSSDKSSDKVPSEPSKELKDLFFRVSYLCKAKTKQYGDGKNSFRCSRL